ncbi:heme-binding-like protein, chloroplastic [Cinnamomum micranthum f. kanehirae]|uniref:Heme-binding-like protein, chloroplastic n=1 Tax=Cinnamomum micranthum f. kanehirae TaxID=337451 RepID=A0A443PLI2_9MAGN|nr:heme-binding-like protein, chloroplastic [Cinnamomum micranthum f. kanehirae]
MHLLQDGPSDSKRKWQDWCRNTDFSTPLLAMRSVNTTPPLLPKFSTTWCSSAAILLKDSASLPTPEQETRKDRHDGPRPPVITQSLDSTAEKINMTAPVITESTSVSVAEEGGKKEMMVKRVEEEPVPVDRRVVTREEGERKYGVVRFSGVATDEVVEERVEKLKKSLGRDGYKVVGQFLLARYNPPRTLPEVMILIE